MSQRGASIQAMLSETPATAPSHTEVRTSACEEPSSSSTAGGVVLAAMKTKIVEWSTRRSSALTGEVGGQRW